MNSLYKYIKDFSNRWAPKHCNHPGHEPPRYIVISKTYTHTCPGCVYTVKIEPQIERNCS